MRFLALAMVASGLALSAQAKLIEDLGQPARTFEESGLKIGVAGEVKPNAPGVGAAKLFLTGAGVRKKKVALFNVNVYVASSYTDKPGALPAASPMDGIAKSKVNALQLTFLRDLSADQVRGAFGESLTHNGADPASPALAAILSKLDMPMPKGSTLTFLGVRGDKGEKIWVEAPGGKMLSSEGPSVARDFWQIWFGKPADGGLDSLRGELSGSKG